MESLAAWFEVLRATVAQLWRAIVDVLTWWTHVDAAVEIGPDGGLAPTAQIRASGRARG